MGEGDTLSIGLNASNDISVFITQSLPYYDNKISNHNIHPWFWAAAVRWYGKHAVKGDLYKHIKNIQFVSNHPTRALNSTHR